MLTNFQKQTILHCGVNMWTVVGRFSKIDTKASRDWNLDLLSKNFYRCVLFQKREARDSDKDCITPRMHLNIEAYF